jgi:hypothetical protein
MQVKIPEMMVNVDEVSGEGNFGGSVPVFIIVVYADFG